MTKVLSRLSSVQPVYTSSKISRTYSENPYIPPVPQGLSTEEHDIKISRLQEFIQNAIEIDQGKNMYAADEVLKIRMELINFFILLDV